MNDVLDRDSIWMILILSTRLRIDYQLQVDIDQLWKWLLEMSMQNWEMARLQLEVTIDDKWSLRSFALAHGAKERVGLSK